MCDDCAAVLPEPPSFPLRSRMGPDEKALSNFERNSRNRRKRGEPQS